MADGADINLTKRLDEIDKQRSGTADDLPKLEHDALKLLTPSCSREEDGEVYFAIARMYANDGMRSPEKVVEYCSKAVNLPMQVDKACQLFLYWGDAVKVKHALSKNSELAQWRREAAVPYLKALKLIFEKKETGGVRQLPPVNIYDYSGPTNDPAYQDLVVKQKEELAAYKKVKTQNELLCYEAKILARITYLYRSEDQDALKRDAEGILDHKQLNTLLEYWGSGKTNDLGTAMQ